jgi:mono/diheme cytochrome c family protein
MSLRIRTIGGKSLAAIAVVLAVVSWSVRTSAGTPQASKGAATSKAASPSNAATIKRGEQLVNEHGCHDCHTPLKMGPQGPEPDMSKALSGHQATEKLPPPPSPSGPWGVFGSLSGTAWAGPWGISYTQNLTPDKETGIGNYTEAQFIMTIREGKKQGRGRALLPPMPWQAFGHMSDADLKAVYAYLQSIPAIKNKVPDPVIAPMK